jgi:hypothetical protein
VEEEEEVVSLPDQSALLDDSEGMGGDREEGQEEAVGEGGKGRGDEDEGEEGSR